jgi:cyclopropane fatty-acyl-phospholipid synthase-like methyltransferase
MAAIPPESSNGYEQAADHFMSARNPRIGVAAVRQWSESLAPGSAILDLGCGHGVPISQVLIDEGFALFGVDASATLIKAFRERFPNARAECAAVEDSQFFQRKFDGIIAWGLMFLLSPDIQVNLFHKIANTLNPGGKFLFTAPEETVNWQDSLTARESFSLGAERYRQILRIEDLLLLGEQYDEGRNHYYLVSKPSTGAVSD